MPEFLTLLPPDKACEKLLTHLLQPTIVPESIDVSFALHIAAADRLLKIHTDATGLSAGEIVEVVLI